MLRLMNIEKIEIITWLNNCAQTFAEQRDYLTQLDADIGDADHGLNMNRGFSRVSEKLESMDKQCIGTILKTTGMTLMSSIGGASGPLYSTFFIRAASTINGKQTLSSQDVVDLFKAGLKGILARGKANAGDKTMCDVWLPVVVACETALANGDNVKDLIDNAVLAAKFGLHSTIEMQAKKGRASYLGERSIGHQDPGATSSMFIIEALQKAINSEE